MIAKPKIILHPFGNRLIPEYRHPERILKIRGKADLLARLKWYSHPFVMNRVPDSVVARRFYVEQTRPALRWWCKKLGVETPKWLEGNAHFDDMEPGERAIYFGEEPFVVHEFEAAEQEGEGGGEEPEEAGPPMKGPPQKGPPSKGPPSKGAKE